MTSTQRDEVRGWGLIDGKQGSTFAQRWCWCLQGRTQLAPRLLPSDQHPPNTPPHKHKQTNKLLLIVILSHGITPSLTALVRRLTASRGTSPRITTALNSSRVTRDILNSHVLSNAATMTRFVVTGGCEDIVCISI